MHPTSPHHTCYRYFLLYSHGSWSHNDYRHNATSIRDTHTHSNPFNPTYFVLVLTATLLSSSYGSTPYSSLFEKPFRDICSNMKNVCGEPASKTLLPAADTTSPPIIPKRQSSTCRAAESIEGLGAKEVVETIKRSSRDCPERVVMMLSMSIFQTLKDWFWFLI